MYNINDKIVPNSEKIREPIEEVRYTPENIWDNMPPEPYEGVNYSDFREYYMELIKRQKIIDLAKVVEDIPGTIVKKETDFFGKFHFFAPRPDEFIYDDDYCDDFGFFPEEEEIEEINNIKDNKSLVRYLEDKFPFNIIKK